MGKFYITYYPGKSSIQEWSETISLSWKSGHSNTSSSSTYMMAYSELFYKILVMSLYQTATKQVTITAGSCICSFYKPLMDWLTGSSLCFNQTSILVMITILTYLHTYTHTHPFGAPWNSPCSGRTVILICSVKSRRRAQVKKLGKM